MWLVLYIIKYSNILFVCVFVVYIPDAQLSADEIFDKDSFSESIIYALPSGL